jgi:hypothetical protein
MEIQKKLITPAKAVELLQANVKNRNPKVMVVSKYARDMANGKWKNDTFELIKISKTGVILDGQHRLMAVVKSNVNVYFHIVDGLDDSILDVLDTGTVRNAADVFKINQVKYASLIPAVISFYDMLKESRKGRSTNVSIRKTNAALLETYYLNPEKWDAIAYEGHNLYNQFGKILTQSFIGGFLAFFSDIDEDAATTFMNQLCTGKNIENDSINLLRMKLVNDKVSTHKLTATTKQMFIIKCWNAYRKNQTLKVIKFMPNQESFPIAI